MYGVTLFDNLNQYFKENYDIIAPYFIKDKNLPTKVENKEEVENLHDAYIKEKKQKFAEAI
jgi:hypothetical protein